MLYNKYCVAHIIYISTVFTVLWLPAYFLCVGLQIDAERFFIYWLVVMLVNIAAVSLAFFISAGVKNAELANSLITLPFIISLVSSKCRNVTCYVHFYTILVSEAVCRITDIPGLPPCVGVMGPVYQLYEVWP